MGVYLQRIQRWIDAAADWLGFSVRRTLTTNPPPMVHGPRIAKAWQKPMLNRPLPPPPRVPTLGPDDVTPVDDETTDHGFKRPEKPRRHARARPPKIERDKP